LRNTLTLNDGPRTQDGGGSRLAANGETRQDLTPPTGEDPQRDVRPFVDRGQQADPNAAPLTGTGFREWSDRLRDVEEMVGDPRLRAEAARIRERAAAIRAEFTRHAQAPNWDMVDSTIGKPLAELRNSVNQELLRRQSAEALVPIDKEPVPPAYSEQVKRYYERLGSGQ
jgi:hypothetical protein